MKSNKAPTTRSPLKQKPLHNPGESAQQSLDLLLEEELLMPFAFTFCLIIVVAYDWVGWYLHVPRQPIILTVAALGMIAYTGYKFIRLRKRYKSLTLGIEGEKYVGQFLEDLRAHGCQIFHDVVGDRFNLDHIVVSPQGIFVIETKTHSKPVRGQTIVEFDGEHILVNGRAPDRDPVIQVKAQVSWLEQMLIANTSRKFPIRGVVVFPDWFVKNTGKPMREIWVLNQHGLPAFMAQEPTLLSAEDIALVSSRIRLHVQDRDQRA